MATILSMPGPNGPEVIWLVLRREVPPTVRVRGAGRLTAVMVLDVATGLVRGIAIETSTRKALQRAFTQALTQPAGDLPPAAPSQVLCVTGLADQARAALTGLALAGTTAPSFTEVQPGQEAEDIFDSFLGHLAGRPQPEELPSPDDWQALIGQAAAFRAAAPWTRWSDEQDLLITLRHEDGSAERYCAVVLGQAGVQHGLALYPGDRLPAGLRDGSADLDAPDLRLPAGTLMLNLDPADELPQELVAKAVRYGWTSTDGRVPVFLALGSDGPEELGRYGAIRLIVGIAAVLRLDRRGPTITEAADVPVQGSYSIAGHGCVTFEIRHRPAPAASEGPTLQFHVAGQELLPPGTAVTLGHVGWPALASLRRSAQVHRPAPADAPAQVGRELPLVVLCPDPRHGPSLTAKIAELDPYGVGLVDTDDGHSVVVLAGGSGAEVLISLPATHPALAAFRRRNRQTKGRHVLLVADASSATGEGAVYGMFECHQPPLPRPASPTRSGKNRR